MLNFLYILELQRKSLNFSSQHISEQNFKSLVPRIRKKSMPRHFSPRIDMGLLFGKMVDTDYFDCRVLGLSRFEVRFQKNNLGQDSLDLDGEHENISKQYLYFCLKIDIKDKILMKITVALTEKKDDLSVHIHFIFWILAHRDNTLTRVLVLK